MNDQDLAASRERLPIEQGARDSIQLAINALEQARDAQTLFGLTDTISTAILELEAAFAIQKVQLVDFEGQGEKVNKVVHELLAHQAGLDRPYKCLANAEHWIVVSAGKFAFRFGPYAAEAAGKIFEQAMQEKIPVVSISNCGAEFDWDLARDVRGLTSTHAKRYEGALRVIQELVKSDGDVQDDILAIIDRALGDRT